MHNVEQFLPDSSNSKLAHSENTLALLHELKLVLQQAQAALLQSSLEEIYANTARLKVILRELKAAAKSSEESVPQTKQDKTNLRLEIAKLKVEIYSESLLYGALIRRKQRTTNLLSGMLPNSAVTYTPPQLGTLTTSY